jgi:UDP-glucuronate decarboxylase
MKSDMKDLIINDYGIDFSSLRNKTILITGASGLIGLHLLSSLKKTQKDLNITIYTWNKTKNNLFDFVFENCNSIYSDITEVTNLDFLPDFDLIIHSSGYGQPSKFLQNKIKTIEINTTVTLRLLNKLKKDGSFLFISSSEVYNGLYENNVTEDQIGLTNPTHPRSPYIESKRCGETICNIFRENGQNVKVVRLGITYGPGTQIGDTRVINSLIDKGLNNETIELLDNGSSIRSFCYINDAVEMIWNVLLKGKDFIYNVSNNQNMSILDLSRIIGDQLNKKVIPSTDKNGLVGNPKFVNLSINKYKNEFNKNTFVGIENGIENTIKWQIKLKKYGELVK